MAIKKKKILLIEDNPSHAEIYQTELDNSGYEVFYTDNEEKAIFLAEKEEPDLILLDLMLGQVSGLDILKKLKSSPVTKDIKVVALTDFKEKDLLEENRLEGVSDYIFKGEVTPREVARKVQGYLE